MVFKWDLKPIETGSYLPSAEFLLTQKNRGFTTQGREVHLRKPSNRVLLGTNIVFILSGFEEGWKTASRRDLRYLSHPVIWHMGAVNGWNGKAQECAFWRPKPECLGYKYTHCLLKIIIWRNVIVSITYLGSILTSIRSLLFFEIAILFDKDKIATSNIERSSVL